jgi:hypothetical protein
MRDLTTADRWPVALPLGLFFDWITAATVVGASQTPAFLGLTTGGTGEAVVGAVLPVSGALFASVMILAGGREASPQGYLAYGAAGLWGLVGAVLGRYDASVLTTGAALVAAALVTVALFGRSTDGPFGDPATQR